MLKGKTNSALAMKLSIIVPVYNIDNDIKFSLLNRLCDSLKIAILRTEDYSFEVIFVNDSTKKSMYNIESCVQKNFEGLADVFFLTNKKNMGQAFSRNLGRQYATGDYLHFIDQDDWVSEDYYLGIDGSSAIFISDVYLTDGKTKLKYMKVWSRNVFQRNKTLKSLWWLLLVNICVSPGQYVIRAKVFDQVGGFTDLYHRGSDDYALLYKLCFSKFPVNIAHMASTFFYYQSEFQTSKTLSITESVNEFFSSVEVSGFKQRILRKIKTNNSFSLFSKVFYLLVFNRWHAYT